MHGVTPSQQPSTHDPLAQSVGTEQVRPGAALHCPSALQVMPPVQLSLSGPLVTGLQMPGVATGPGGGVPGCRLAAWSQLWHVPQTDSQQTPSTQWPVSHCVSAVHAPPCEWYSHVSARAVPPALPPNMTTRPRAASYAIATWSRAPGPAGPPICVQDVPFHCQVSSSCGLPVLPPNITVLPGTASNAIPRSLRAGGPAHGAWAQTSVQVALVPSQAQVSPRFRSG